MTTNPGTTVSEINIVPVKPRDGLIAFASFVVDNKFYVGNVAIFTRLDGHGIRLVFPKKRVGDALVDCVHPIKREVGEAITEAVERKYEEVFGSNLEDVYETQTIHHGSL